MHTVFAYSLDQTDPLAVFAPLHNHPYSLFFDSADKAHVNSRYSFIAYHPFETIESKDGQITITNKDNQLSFRGDALNTLKQRLQEYGLGATPSRGDLPPFQGGAAGYFGYDLVRGMEKLPQTTTPSAGIPDMAIGLYNKVVAFDHEKNKSWLLVLAENEKQGREYLHHFKALQNERAAPPLYQGTALDWQASFTKESYEARLGKIIDYIYAGDIFQANMTQDFTAALPANFDAFAHYCHLRSVNPAPFSSFMNFGNLKIASSSPERFLKLQNRQIETKPIKGTRKRLADPTLDNAAKLDLQTSLKDRAENVMIVDLLRNDLSKVCDDFSVEVPELCALESFASVHHLVSTVTASLRADCDAVDLLTACFPGGSVTGAPKVRAMEIIEENEIMRRGPYCGAMGYIGFNGTMDTNITIRTLIYNKNSVRFNVGGGIVADSVPATEYQETLDKAAALFASFATQDKAKERA